MRGLRRFLVAFLVFATLLAGFTPPLPKAQAAACTVSTTPDGRPYVGPTATGPGTGKKIGFDNTHGETAGAADWVLDGGFSVMACGLAGQGYTVEEIRAYPLTTGTLTSYSAVVIPEPNIPLTTAEQQALEGYVAGGGGLLLVGDHYQADRNYNTWDATEVFNGFRRGHYGHAFSAPAYHYNGVDTDATYIFNDGSDWLATAFGIRFRFNAMDLVDAANRPFAAGNPADPADLGIVSPSGSQGITSGVNTLATYAGATISIVDPARAMGIVYPNKGTLKRWNNAQADDPVALYTDSVGAPAGGEATFGGINEGAYVAIAKPNAGKVAAAGDSSLWEDATPKYKKEADGASKRTHDGWTDRDHAQLGINLVNWLATPDTSTGIAPALRQPATPEPVDLFTIAEPLNEPWTNPPSGYLWYDSHTFKAGAYTGGKSGGGGGGGGGTATWTFSAIPARTYPGNRLAIYLDGRDLGANASFSTQAYLYVSGSGTQISRRYNRSTQSFADALTAQTLAADSAGALQRWEFWELTSSANRAISARLKVDGATQVTQSLNQVATGSFGYLSIPQHLGFSNGGHAALFRVGSTLDTAVWIAANTDTTITLPAGTYTMEIRDDASSKLANVSVTITEGQTVSLADLLAPADTTPPTLTYALSPQPNAAGWNNTDVTVTFTCKDEGAGIATCPDPVVLSAEGADQQVSGVATDRAGNTAQITTQPIKIDKTAPVVTVEGGQAYEVDAQVKVTCTAQDTLSGMAEDPCTGPLVEQPAYALELGSHEVAVRAADQAGNVTTTAATYSVAVSYRSLCRLTSQFAAKKGIAKSLKSKLRAAAAAEERGDLNARDGALGAYRNGVEAQQGKALTMEQGAVLGRLSQSLQH